MKKHLALEQNILNFVSLSVKRRGQPPTVREIAKRFAISASTTHYHLKKLKLRKRLQFRYGLSRRVSRGLKIRTFVRKENRPSDEHSS